MVSIPVDHTDQPVKEVFPWAMSVNPLVDPPQIVFHVVLSKLSPQSFQVSWQMVAWPLSHYPPVKILVWRKTHPSLLIDILNHVDLLINLALDSATTMMSTIPTTGEMLLSRQIYRSSHWNVDGSKVWEWTRLTGYFQCLVLLTDSCLPIIFGCEWSRLEILLFVSVRICCLPGCSN